MISEDTGNKFPNDLTVQVVSEEISKYASLDWLNDVIYELYVRKGVKYRVEK